MARIFVVDDSPDIREMVGLVLRLEGHHVVEVADGAALLEHPMGPDDVVVLDVMMPVLDGYGALRQLRLRGASAPRVVMLTAKCGEQDRQRSLTGGAVSFLTKPFEPDDLIAAVARVVRSDAIVLAEARDHDLYVSRLLSMLERTS